MKKKIAVFMFSLCALGQAANAQAYGAIYPKYQGIYTVGANSGISGNLWKNGLGDSYNYPTWAYAYGTIKAGTGDSQAFMTVSNRNLLMAITTSATLGNFMHGLSYANYATQNIGFNNSVRYCGADLTPLYLGNGTTVGFGVRASDWRGYSATNAETGYQIMLYSNWGYQPGQNPKVNAGNYSNYAWTRAGYLGTFSLQQPPLGMGQGRTRRWSLGYFTTAIDSAGNSPYRYVFTTAESLTASTASGIFLIKSTQLQSFLNNGSFYYSASLHNTALSQEIVLQAGTTYYVVVQDGVNTTESEGAQVLVYAAYYR